MKRAQVILISTLIFPLLTPLLFSACQQIQQNDKQVITVGFYAYFAPISYSADPDPTSEKFNTHLGYEADLLTALETMERANLSFSRRAIAEWSDIWLKSANPQYDIIGGGITILEKRTQNAAGVQTVNFTSGHIQFRQSILVRAEDAKQLSDYASLTSDVRVGVLPATTGEARLLEITGLVDTKGILTAGTRIKTSQSTLLADGTVDYMITAAGTSPNLVDRLHIHPFSANLPQVVYLGQQSGESELREALEQGNIDAVARGEIGNRQMAHSSDGKFVVTAIDEQVEYGGFTLALQDTELMTHINEKIDYLIDGGNIGYKEWLQDPQIFMKQAEVWNATVP